MGRRGSPASPNPLCSQSVEKPPAPESSADFEHRGLGWRGSPASPQSPMFVIGGEIPCPLNPPQISNIGNGEKGGAPRTCGAGFQAAASARKAPLKVGALPTLCAPPAAVTSAPLGRPTRVQPYWPPGTSLELCALSLELPLPRPCPIGFVTKGSIAGRRPVKATRRFRGSRRGC